MVSLSSIYAFKVVFARTGEAALRLAPADAIGTISIDLVPSPEQAITFKRIDDDFASAGMDQIAHMSFLEALGKKCPDELKSLTTRNVSAFFVAEPGNPGSAIGALLSPITDAKRAQEILAQSGPMEYFKGTAFYHPKNQHMYFMVRDDVLVACEAPWVLHLVDSVRSGEVPRLTDSPAYLSVRAKAPADANVLFLMSPKLLDFGKEMGLNKLGKEWAEASVTIQDGGLALQSSGRFDATQDATLAALGHTAPLPDSVYRRLPAGAYGLTAFAQPSNYVDTAINSSKKAKSMSNDMEKSLKDATGMDLQDDILPALKGDLIVAAYPSTGTVAGADVLIELDDAHGADPATLADKVQKWVDKKVHEDKNGPGDHWIQNMDIPGARAYKLGDDVEKEFHKNADVGKQINNDVLLGQKTVAWAMVDKAVIFSTSKDLLTQAVATYQGRGATLAGDHALGTDNAPDGSQTMAVFSLSRIATGIRNTVVPDKMDSDARKMMDSVLGMFEGLKEPLALKGHLAEDGGFGGSLFIPLDYDRIISFVGSKMKK